MTRSALAAGAAALVFASCAAYEGLEARKARASGEAALEAEKARSAGLLVAEHEGATKLADEVMHLTQESGDLKDELAKIKATVPSVKVVRVERLVSRDTIASGAARPGSGPSPSGASGTGLPRPGGGAAEPCLLAAGDHLQLDVDAITLRSVTSNEFVTGHWRLYRIDPHALAARIADGTFDGRASRVATSDSLPAPSPRWAFRALAAFTRPGAPTGAVLGVDRKLFGPLWFTAEGHLDLNVPSSLAAGLRWEW